MDYLFLMTRFPDMKLSPRVKFLLLIGLFALPVIVAYVAYYGWRPAGHGNYGELIETRPLQHTAGVLSDGTQFDLQQLRGKWVMVHVGPAACDDACTQQLYHMRQVRLTQGKNQSRIARLWVLADAGTPSAALLNAHPGLVVWRPDHAGFLAQWPAVERPSAHIYLVDPLGNQMLRFPAALEPKRMMKDLKLLLKASQIG